MRKNRQYQARAMLPLAAMLEDILRCLAREFIILWAVCQQKNIISASANYLNIWNFQEFMYPEGIFGCFSRKKSPVRLTY